MLRLYDSAAATASAVGVILPEPFQLMWRSHPMVDARVCHPWQPACQGFLNENYGGETKEDRRDLGVCERTLI